MMRSSPPSGAWRSNLSQQIRVKRDELQRAHAAVLAIPRLEGMLDQIPALQDNFPGTWASMPDHDKRQVVAAFII